MARKPTGKRKITEDDVTQEVKYFLKSIGVFFWKHWQGPLSPLKGVSDIIGIVPGGRFLAIELKRPGNKPTDNQEKFIANIKRAGGIAFWADNLDDVIAELKAEGVRVGAWG